MFQQPAQGGDKVPVAELVNSLVLIWAREYRTGITTTFGEKDAVACDIHVLDGPKAGEVFDNALLFQGALIGALKPAVNGDPVLARVGTGTSKPGQNAPYVLNPFTQADAAVATAYIARMPKPFQAPAANGAAPANPPAAAAAAAASPSPAAASPATANPPAPPAAAAAVPDYSALPPEVQALLQQSGMIPA